MVLDAAMKLPKEFSQQKVDLDVFNSCQNSSPTSVGKRDDVSGCKWAYRGEQVVVRYQLERCIECGI